MEAGRKDRERCSLGKRLLGWLGQRILAGLWTLLALFILLYGNGETDMVTLVLYSDKLNRQGARSTFSDSSC